MAVSKTTPLLELLAGRWHDFIEKIPDPTRDKPVARPVVDDKLLRQFREAARSWAEANLSDPFAYGRAMRYMRQGLWLPSEVMSQARGLVGARKAQGVTFAYVSDANA
jgi:hypothetical protein